MSELETALRAFYGATGCGAALWVEGGGDVRVAAAAPPELAPPDSRPPADCPHPALVQSPLGPVLVSSVPGPTRAWLAVGPVGPGGAPSLDAYLAFLLPVVAQLLQSALEVEHAANELAERYEEINLLYTITEMLGRTLELEETASTILKEISETVGARRGSILVLDRVTGTLQAVAALGTSVRDIPPVDQGDPASVSAAVFRDQRATIVEAGEREGAAEAPYRRGAMLSVPITWNAPREGAEPLGVVNLSDRQSGQPFTAGDQKLIAAIATQIGTAIQNARLVRTQLNQEALLREMAMAHDLQMKLLPRAEVVAPDAAVAARVIPAESVGGDFYNLYRLGGGSTGVMIGDVSSHGYRAALIMALAMSASAIHAQGSRDPGQVLTALLATLREELATTEMFISTFYGVIDGPAGTLRYANAGHPHAFLIDAGGHAERLPSTDPPLGMVEESPHAVTRPWRRREDLLLLFTDGVSDARDRFGARYGERRVVEVVARHRDQPPAAILERVLADVKDHTGDAVQRDDQTCVILRS